MSDRYPSPAQIFILKASEDEKTLGLEGVPETVSGFHAQQAVEKLIKALLLELKVPFDLTHDLTRLQRLLEAAGEKLPSTPQSLENLNDFAVFYRYELLDEYELPARADLLDTVRIVREHVIARMAALSNTS